MNETRFDMHITSDIGSVIDVPFDLSRNKVQLYLNDIKMVEGIDYERCSAFRICVHEDALKKVLNMLKPLSFT
jgi:hypothetical protein